jgi:tetratricopeptide (TPR) repeat protein
MYALFISSIIAFIFAGAASLMFGLAATITIGVIVLIAAFILIGRSLSQKIQAAMFDVQKTLQRGPQYAPQAVEQLKKIRDQYGKWQFLTTSSLNGQIGSILFMLKKFNEAEDYLQNATSRMWQSQAMLAVIHAQKKEFDKVDRALDKAAKYSPKQGLLWSLWAYVHWKAGHHDRAIEKLLRGKKILGEADHILDENLLALQNQKKMKMKGYGEAWYQFQLEVHPRMKEAQRGGVRFARQ